MSDDPTRSPAGEEPLPDRCPEDDGLPELDDLAAERLLDGMPSDGPIAARLADVLAAARGPARPDELAGEASALAAFRAARATAWPEQGQPVPVGAPRSSPRRGPRTQHIVGPAANHGYAPAGARASRATTRESRAVRAPVIVLTLLLVLGGLGGAAIAAGLTVGAGPDPSSSVAHTTRPPASGNATAGVPSGGADPTTTGGDAASASGGPASSTKGPGLSPGARKKLCRAWSAHGGGASPGKSEGNAEAMRALIKAAGGADRVEEYCRGRPPSKPAGKDPAGQAAVTTAPGTASTAPTEPAADAGAQADTLEDSQEQGSVSSLPSGGGPAPQEPSVQDRRTVQNSTSSRSSGEAGAQRSLL